MKDTQRRALDFVREQLEGCGVSPSCREIGEALDISSVAAWKATEALIGQGKLVRTNAARRYLKLPDQADLSAVTTEQLRAELARRGLTLDALAQPKPLRGAQCAAPLCIGKVQRGHIMCRDHWFRVPRTIREQLLTAHARRDPSAYQDAFTAAVDSLGGFTRVVERVA